MESPSPACSIPAIELPNLPLPAPYSNIVDNDWKQEGRTTLATGFHFRLCDRSGKDLQHIGMPNLPLLLLRRTGQRNGNCRRRRLCYVRPCILRVTELRTISSLSFRSLNVLAVSTAEYNHWTAFLG